MSIRHWSAFVAILVCTAPAVHAQSNARNQLLISSATADLGTGGLVIRGTNFTVPGDATVVVTLSGQAIRR